MQVQTVDAVPVEVLRTVGAHFTTLTSITLYAEHAEFSLGLLELAKSCPALAQAVLLVTITGETLIEFCRLCPNLIELQIAEKIGILNTEHVVLALNLLPGTRTAYCKQTCSCVSTIAMHNAVAMYCDDRLLHLLRILPTFIAHPFVIQICRHRSRHSGRRRCG